MRNQDDTPRDDSARFDSRNAADGGFVERLLNSAGPGPEIPEGGADRIKTAIRQSWQDEVAINARQRRRLWAGGAAAAAAIVAAVLVLPILQKSPVETRPDGITVAVIDGSLEVTPPGSTVEFFASDDVGVRVPDGSLVRTREGHRASLRLTGGQSLRLDVDTTIRLDSERSISLDSGAIYISSDDGAGSGVEVRTAFGTATEIGTQFEVRLGGDTLAVAVREGMVSLTSEGEDYRITHGVRLSVDGDGAVTTASITPFDPAWAWTQEIAPAFEIEGRSALAFLDWVSAETGFSVRFADADVEKSAATTVLHGTIQGLGPSDAPSAVLPTCGLRAVAEPGALLIVRLEPTNDRP